MTEMIKMETMTVDDKIYEIADKQARSALEKQAEEIADHKEDTASHVTSTEKETWNNKVDKTGITLDKHTDGLIYIFIDGVPKGNGVEFTGEVVEGDVIGYIDENNNIVLSGALAEDNYTVKYEMENGTLMDIGTLSLKQEEVTIVNQIPISVTSSGALFVGTNGEAGYKTGYRLSGSTGNESAQTGIEVTGFIPVAFKDNVYFKNITDDSTHVIGFYKSDFSLLATTNFNTLLGGAVNGEVVSFTLYGINNVTEELAYMRVSATEITADSIITVNQAIA